MTETKKDTPENLIDRVARGKDVRTVQDMIAGREEERSADQVSLAEALSRKEGIFVAIPNIGATISTPLAYLISALNFQTVDINSPYFFKVFMPNDVTPVEYARNVCVQEFLSDPYYKRLWFMDADAIPAGNALDLLNSPDEAIVSGMTMIWNCEELTPEGTYRPPTMKINGFRWKRKEDTFESLVPPRGSTGFHCDAAGAACLLIKRQVFEDVGSPWFRTLRDPMGRMLRGEDLDFCRRAMLKGHRVWYRPDVAFGHRKFIDLLEVTKYGVYLMKSLSDRIRGGAEVPSIYLPGEKHQGPPPNAPANLEVVA